MKSKILLFLTIPFWSNLSAQNSNGNCNFYFDYSTTLGWNQVGTLVEIQGGKVEFINGAPDGSVGSSAVGIQRRLHYDLGMSLNSSDSWVAEFEFTPLSVGTHINGQPHTGHTLLALTAGNQEPFNDCVDLACSGYPTGSQDGIILTYGSDNPATGNLFFLVRAKDGLNETASTKIISNTLGATLYPRLIRVSSIEVKLEVYSDSGRTNHIAGSPIVFPVSSGIEGLNTVQHGNVVRGQIERELTGSIDNLCINYSGVNIVEETMLSNLNTFPNLVEDYMIIENSNEFKVEFILFNLSGQVVLKSGIGLKENFEIDFKTMPSGLYMIHFFANGAILNKKVIKI